jgi:hypothetical protein
MKYFSLFALILLLAACNSTEKLICRTWKVTDISFNTTLGDFDVKMQKQIRKQLMTDVTFTFKRDSAYILHKQDSVYRGKWWLWADKKTFTTYNELAAGNSDIVSITKKQMVFKVTDPAGKVMTFTCVPTTGKK